MALVSSSQVITDQEATPRVKVNLLEKGGVVKTAQGTLALASYTGGTVGQWYLFVRVPLRARIIGVKLSQATTTSGAVDVGLYRTASNGGAVIDADFFKAAHVLGATTNIRAEVSSLTVYTALLRQSSLRDAAAAALTAASATADVEVDIGTTIVTVIGTPTDATLEVDYVLPEN
jgi:hypothetical protein